MIVQVKERLRSNNSQLFPSSHDLAVMSKNFCPLTGPAGATSQLEPLGTEQRLCSKQVDDCLERCGKGSLLVGNESSRGADD